MSAAIQVVKQSEGHFQVTVQEGGSQSSHLVSVAPDYARTLTAGRVSTEELVRCSFEFLLEREPKESILSSFDLPVIGRYFPEYEREIKKRIGG
jgi:hypothetical protein